MEFLGYKFRNVIMWSEKNWKNELKRTKIEDINTLLQGVILAQKKVGLKMNVPRGKLNEVIELLPALRSPTVSELFKSDWYVGDQKKRRTLVRFLMVRVP